MLSALRMKGRRSHWKQAPIEGKRQPIVLHTVYSLCNDCFGNQDICPYSEGPLQSECSNWLPMVSSLHQNCPYIECPYKENLLYHQCSFQSTASKSLKQDGHV